MGQMLALRISPRQLLPFTKEEREVMLSGSLAPSSIAMYQRDVAAYEKWAENAALDPYDPYTLLAWKEHLASSTAMSPNTINRMMSAVRRFMRDASAHGRLAEEIEIRFSRVEGVKKRALKTRLKEHSRTRIEPEDMRRLCETPESSTPMGKRDRALLATLASSGIRAEELAALTWDRVKKLHKGYAVLVRGKTDIEYREAPLSAEAYQLLMAWKVAQPVISAFVFTGFSGNRQLPSFEPISKTAVWKIVTRYAEQCELAYIKPHDFRRFVGTQLAAKDIRKAQAALGHKSIETTARHYVLDRLEPGLTDNLY